MIHTIFHLVLFPISLFAIIHKTVTGHQFFFEKIHGFVRYGLNYNIPSNIDYQINRLKSNEVFPMSYNLLIDNKNLLVLDVLFLISGYFLSSLIHFIIKEFNFPKIVYILFSTVTWSVIFLLGLFEIKSPLITFFAFGYLLSILVTALYGREIIVLKNLSKINFQYDTISQNRVVISFFILLGFLFFISKETENFIYIVGLYSLFTIICLFFIGFIDKLMYRAYLLNNNLVMNLLGDNFINKLSDVDTYFLGNNSSNKNNTSNTQYTYNTCNTPNNHSTYNTCIENETLHLIDNNIKNNDIIEDKVVIFNNLLVVGNDTVKINPHNNLVSNLVNNLANNLSDNLETNILSSNDLLTNELESINLSNDSNKYVENRESEKSINENYSNKNEIESSVQIIHAGKSTEKLDGLKNLLCKDVSIEFYNNCINSNSHLENFKMLVLEILIYLENYGEVPSVVSEESRKYNNYCDYKNSYDILRTQNLLEHSILVATIIYNELRDLRGTKDIELLMLTGLCHDLGKIYGHKNIKSYEKHQHAKSSVLIMNTEFESFKEYNAKVEVESLVINHHRDNSVLSKTNTDFKSDLLDLFQTYDGKARRVFLEEYRKDELEKLEKNISTVADNNENPAYLEYGNNVATIEELNESIELKTKIDDVEFSSSKINRVIELEINEYEANNLDNNDLETNELANNNLKNNDLENNYLENNINELSENEEEIEVISSEHVAEKDDAEEHVEINYEEEIVEFINEEKEILHEECDEPYVDFFDDPYSENSYEDDYDYDDTDYDEAEENIDPNIDIESEENNINNRQKDEDNTDIIDDLIEIEELTENNLDANELDDEISEEDLNDDYHLIDLSFKEDENIQYENTLDINNENSNSENSNSENIDSQNIDSKILDTQDLNAEELVNNFGEYKEINKEKRGEFFKFENLNTPKILNESNKNNEKNSNSNIEEDEISASCSNTINEFNHNENIEENELNEDEALKDVIENEEIEFKSSDLKLKNVKLGKKKSEGLSNKECNLICGVSNYKQNDTSNNFIYKEFGLQVNENIDLSAFITERDFIFYFEKKINFFNNNKVAAFTVNDDLVLFSINSLIFFIEVQARNKGVSSLYGVKDLEHKSKIYINSATALLRKYNFLDTRYIGYNYSFAPFEIRDYSGTVIIEKGYFVPVKLSVFNQIGDFDYFDKRKKGDLMRYSLCKNNFKKNK